MQAQAFLARFHGSGVIDDSFGHDGVFSTSAGLSGDALYAVALQPDGKIVAANREGGATSYTVAFDDGDRLELVPAAEIRAL